MDRESHRGGFGISVGHASWTEMIVRGARAPRGEEAGEGKMSEGEEGGRGPLKGHQNYGLSPRVKDRLWSNGMYGKLYKLSFSCLLSLASLLFLFSFFCFGGEM